MSISFLIVKHVFFFFYVKCILAKIRELWDTLIDVGANVTIPWIIGGDFNTILQKDECVGCT